MTGPHLSDAVLDAVMDEFEAAVDAGELDGPRDTTTDQEEAA